MADQHDWVIGIVFGPLFVAAALAYWVGRRVTKKHGFRRLFQAAPGPTWSFDCWTTDLAAVAAAVGRCLEAQRSPVVAGR